MLDAQKYLDFEGVKYLWSKINMQDYPNNKTLVSVINAIDETKADKTELVQADWDEVDETSMAFIKNKPNMDELATEDYVNEQTQGYVSYKDNQSLTDEQRNIARQNIGVNGYNWYGFDVYPNSEPTAYVANTYDYPNNVLDWENIPNIITKVENLVSRGYTAIYVLRSNLLMAFNTSTYTKEQRANACGEIITDLLNLQENGCIQFNDDGSIELAFTSNSHNLLESSEYYLRYMQSANYLVIRENNTGKQISYMSGNISYENFYADYDTTLTLAKTPAEAKAVGEAITNLNNLVGETKVSEQISNAIAQKSQVQIITWEADD